MAEYTLKKSAENDLEEIWHYTAKNWGTTQAVEYTHKLEQIFSVLADNPLMCRERFEFDPPTRIHHHASHLIVYLLTNNDHIKIIRILHESMDIDLQLQQ